MTHFSELRDEVRKLFSTNESIRRRIERACLMWDLQGKLRVLLKPVAGADPSALEADVVSSVTPLASTFWTKEVWIWNDRSGSSERALFEKAWNEAQDVIDEDGPEVRILERHVAKDAWFALQTKAPWPLNEHTPAIIAFYSFKGGVGRTTTVLSLAVQLARSGHRVAVADLDLEAPGAGAALPSASERDHGCGVVDYLLERPLVNSSNDLDLADFYYSIDDPVVVKTGPPITVVPAGKVDDKYLEKLARVDYRRLNAMLKSDPAHSPLTDLLERLSAAERRIRSPRQRWLPRSGWHGPVGDRAPGRSLWLGFCTELGGNQASRAVPRA